MHRAKYCILNRQYTKDEYEQLAGTIVSSLEREGEWGEHLPIRLSPFGYNESAAPEYYPLTEEITRERRWRWCDALPYTTGKETTEWKDVADDIADVPDTIVDEIFGCVACRKNFKIIPAELSFYKRMPVPLPRQCPDCRHLARFRRKTPTKLWPRSCNKCGAAIRTTYAPERPEKVHCKECYLKEVY
jgi:hypothetical protein